jgi:hypothetical protein
VLHLKIVASFVDNDNVMSVKPLKYSSCDYKIDLIQMLRIKKGKIGSYFVHFRFSVIDLIQKSRINRGKSGSYFFTSGLVLLIIILSVLQQSKYNLVSHTSLYFFHCCNNTESSIITKPEVKK